MIDADMDIMPLGCAVITQAVKDARDVDPIRALDAALFLVGPDAALWLDELGMDLDPVALVCSGRARRVRKEVVYGEKRKRADPVRRTHAKGDSSISYPTAGSRQRNPRRSASGAGRPA